MRKFMLFLDVSLVLSWPMVALAQAAPVAPDTDAGAIVVTARRTEEKLQNVPVSIEVFTQKALTERSIASAADLGKAVTGLVANANAGNPSQITFSIRGRGQTYGSATGSVETYFSDIPLSSSFGMPAPPPQFFDLASFQILKGPQGTLFGRNTTGGAVVIVPQAPKPGVAEGYVRLQSGTYANFQGEAAVNIPIGDRVALRLAAFDWQRDGYMRSAATDVFTGAPQLDNPNRAPLGGQRFNTVDTTQLRASLLVKPSDGFENSTVLSYIIEKNRASRGSGLLQGPRVAPTPANPYGVTVALEPVCGRYCTYTDTRIGTPPTRYWILSNSSRLSLGDSLTIRNILGYIHASGYTDDGTDADGTSLPVIDLPAPARPKKSDQFTEELQVQGVVADGRVTYLIGGMYDKVSQPTGVNDINPYSVTYYASAGINFTNFQSTSISSKAVFATATVKPLEAVNITGGYRHTWTDLVQTQGSALSPAGSPLPLASAAVASQAASYAGDTYNIGVDYHISADLMIYGGYRHGFKRGGIDPATTQVTSFAPEKVDDVTLGLKSSFHVLDMPARFNVEAFYDSYHGMQTNFLYLDSAARLVTKTVNIPRVRYRGFDLDVRIDPARWLGLSGGYSYNDARILRWTDVTGPAGATPIDLANNPVPYNIRNKFTVSARLHGEVPGHFGEAVLLGSVNHQSLFYNNANAFTEPYGTARSFGLDNPASFCVNGLCGSTIPGYTTVDLRLELNHAFGSRFDLAATVINLTDKLFYTGTSSTLDFGFEGFSYGPPRMFTFEVRTKF